MMKKLIEVSVVAYQEGDCWIAQGVEYDIRARAKILTDLPLAFERAVMANVCMNVDLGRDDLSGINRAPEKFKELFERGSMNMSPVQKSKNRTSPVKIRDIRLANA